MDARRWGLAIAILALACAPPKERPDGQFVQQGRLYTAWLYGNEYNKLWERFSPRCSRPSAAWASWPALPVRPSPTSAPSARSWMKA